MSNFILYGGKPLSGEIRVGGSKNTILPLIAACMLTEEPCIIEGVPDISDVATMFEIAKGLGANIEWDKNARRMRITAQNFVSSAPNVSLSRKLRGSVLFAGALLGRLREVSMPSPGGDVIGARPLVTHFRALEALGAHVDLGDLIYIKGNDLRGGEVLLEESSVTATENAILAAVLAPGKTIIRLPATEPHVQELVLFLARMGADIRWRDLSRLEIEGVKRLSGAAHRVNPDEQEISSFSVLAATTQSHLTLRGVEPEYLDAVRLQLQKMHIPHVFETGGVLRIRCNRSRFQGFRIQAGLYPKLGSDHLPPFAVLATQSEGESLIHDWLYEDRFRYIAELQKMGAECKILDPHRALISGPTHLYGADITSFDIRSGMTLVIAALAAEGKSTISNIQHLDRGYESIAERLAGIGAAIERVEN